MYNSKLERSLYQRCRDYGGSNDGIDALRYRHSHHPNTFHLSECPQRVWHATTIASGYTSKWSHGVPFNHSSAQTNFASSLRMEHLCQSSQTSTIRNAPENPLFLQVNQRPLHIMSCFKNRLPCSMYCKCGGQCENGGSVPDGCH